MTATRLFVYSLISLVVSTCAVAGMFFLGDRPCYRSKPGISVGIPSGRTLRTYLDWKRSRGYIQRRTNDIRVF